MGFDEEMPITDVNGLPERIVENIRELNLRLIDKCPSQL
jgi:hypothetical protein